MIVFDSMKEWNFVKECMRRLVDGKKYTLTDIARIIGKTGSSSNVSRDPIFAKLIGEGVLVLDGKKKLYDGGIAYRFDRTALVSSSLDFWLDELKRATGKRVEVVRF